MDRLLGKGSAKKSLPRAARLSRSPPRTFHLARPGMATRSSLERAATGSLKCLTPPEHPVGSSPPTRRHRRYSVIRNGCPAARAILFTAGAAGATGTVCRVAEDGSDGRKLVEGAVDGRYLKSGHLIYTLGEALVASSSFDLTRFRAGRRSCSPCSKSLPGRRLPARWPCPMPAAFVYQFGASGDF